VAYFEVHVVPLSSQPGPAGRHGGVPRLRVKAPPTDGRANAEAEELLSDLLGARVRIVGGTQARRKRFEVDEGRSETEERLRSVFGE
jgi:hypothetical protein